MPKRKIIQLDEERCDGCGLCVPNCPEGAIQILDGKARLVSDRFCDGLGACLGNCPNQAITIEEREAEPYNESLVMAKIVQQGSATIAAHLDHLKDHGETDLHNSFNSALRHWPVQMHLISPSAPQYRGQNLLLSADCVAYAAGDFHTRHLPGKSLAIACPKLDENQDVYSEKLKMLIDEAGIKSLYLMIMQVPCCRGLLRLALDAAACAQRQIPIHCSTVSIEGEILKEEWIREP